MKQLLILFTFLVVIHGFCNLKAEEKKFAKFYKKYYLRSLSLKQARTLIKKMESFIKNTNAGDMETFFDFIIQTSVSLLPAAKQKVYMDTLKQAAAKLGSQAKYNTVMGQLKAAVVAVADPYFTIARKDITMNPKAGDKAKNCLAISSLGPYFNKENSKAVMDRLKAAADPGDLKTFKKVMKKLMPLLGLH